MPKYTCDIADPNDTRNVIHRIEDVFSLDKIKINKFFHPICVNHFVEEYNNAKKSGANFHGEFYYYAIHHMIKEGGMGVVQNFYKYSKIPLPTNVNSIENPSSSKIKEFYGINSPLFVAVAFGKSLIFEIIFGYVRDTLAINQNTWVLLLKLAISSQEFKMVKDIFEEVQRRQQLDVKKQGPLHPFFDIQLYKLLLQTAVLYPKLEILTYVSTVIKNACCPDYQTPFEDIADAYFIHGSKIKGADLENFFLSERLIHAMSFDTAIACGFAQLIQCKLSQDAALLTNAQLEKCITSSITWGNLTLLKHLVKHQAITQDLWQKGLTFALQENNKSDKLDTQKLEWAWYFLFKMEKPQLDDLLSVYGLIQRYAVAEFIKDVMLEKFAKYLSISALSRYSLDDLMDNLKKAAIAKYSFIESHIEDYAKVAFATKDTLTGAAPTVEPIGDLISFEDGHQPSLIFRPREGGTNISQNSLNTTSASEDVSPFKDDSGKSWTPFINRP